MASADLWLFRTPNNNMYTAYQEIGIAKRTSITRVLINKNGVINTSICDTFNHFNEYNTYVSMSRDKSSICLENSI